MSSLGISGMDFAPKPEFKTRLRELTAEFLRSAGAGAIDHTDSKPAITNEVPVLTAQVSDALRSRACEEAIGYDPLAAI